MIQPPRWTGEQLENDIRLATGNFRRERMQEPLGAYLAAFDHYRDVVELLLEASAGLAEMSERGGEVLTNPDLLEAFRYVTGPPLSADDLKTVSDAVLTPTRLREDRETVSVDFRGSEPDGRGEGGCRDCLCGSHGDASRRYRPAALRKDAQELLAEKVLASSGLKKVEARPIPTLNNAPQAGEFCRESLLGSRKADLVVRLWDHRIMPVECRVSNSALNSIKRVNNDAAAKAETWNRDFGTRNIVPAAVLSGVFKLRHLMDAQDRGLTIFWAHDLEAMCSWIEQTRG